MTTKDRQTPTVRRKRFRIIVEAEWTYDPSRFERGLAALHPDHVQALRAFLDVVLHDDALLADWAREDVCNLFGDEEVGRELTPASDARDPGFIALRHVIRRLPAPSRRFWEEVDAADVLVENLEPVLDAATTALRLAVMAPLAEEEEEEEEE